jgi:hypothetical protein
MQVKEAAERERAVQLQIEVLTGEIRFELDRARRCFPPFNTAHEGYAILLEEVEELWAEIKANQQTPGRDTRMRREAIQVAAMALRFLVDGLMWR